MAMGASGGAGAGARHWLQPAGGGGGQGGAEPSTPQPHCLGMSETYQAMKLGMDNDIVSESTTSPGIKYKVKCLNKLIEYHDNLRN